MPSEGNFDPAGGPHHVPGARKHRGLFENSITKFSDTANLRVPAACDPKVPAPAKPFSTDAPPSSSATWAVRKAHMGAEAYAESEAPTLDPMRTGRKGQAVLPGQFNVTWSELEKQLGFEIDPKMINFGAIGEGCSDPAALNRYVSSPNGGVKYHGMFDNQKLWYSKEPAEMLFHEKH
jgi:hypothetical protein